MVETVSPADLPNGGKPAVCQCGQWRCRACRIRQVGKEQQRYVPTAEEERLLRAAYQAATAEEMKQGLARLRARRPRWPRWVWPQIAARMGLHSPRPRRPYTRADDLKLLDLLGSMPVGQVAREMGRSVRSVDSRARMLQMSLAVRDGFTAHELAECLGVHEQTVAQWITEGLFTPRELLEVGRITRITEPGVRRFLRRHPERYSLHRVSEVWFKSMVFD